MANTLKDLAASAKLVSQDALEQALTDLKSYIDTQDTAGGSAATAAIQNLQQQLDTLVGGDGDLDTIINTFNEVKAFLADYAESDTLKNLIDAAISAATTAAGNAETNAKSYTDTKVGAEETRATAAEGALSGRVTTLENVAIMTATEATTIFNGVFNPSNGN
jgi:hypothetical protein